MADVDPSRLRRCFDRALELRGPERAAFLDRACATDLELHREVESLLASAERDDSILDRPLHVPAGNEPREATAPALLGPYRIGELLGRGGMGVVYRAVDSRTGAPVAIKTLTEAGPGLSEGIRREIHSLSRMRHPGIVRILDQGVTEETPWYAMELLEGETLGAKARAIAGGAAEPSRARSPWWTRTLTLSAAGPSPALHPGDVPQLAAPRGAASREILTIVRRLCGTLAYLHGEGIVHRDLKPDNVLVTPDGFPVLLDFGLATPFSGALSRETLDVAPGPMGTVAYVAPEQGEGILVDARADLYALGAIIYELCTGQPPFCGDSPYEVFQRRYLEDPVRPSALCGDLPAGLDDLVMRLLARSPRDRMGHASDVAAALVRLGADDVELPGPAPRPYLYRPGFVGREGPLSELRQLLTGLADGRGALVLIAGESGVGKTRLAVAAAAEASSLGLRAHTGECLPAAGMGSEAARPPLGPLRDILLSEPALGGGQAPALLTDIPGSSTATAELPPAASREQLFDALLVALATLASKQPYMLIIDDLQWADELTLEVLKRLAPRLSHTPILLLATYRIEEPKAEIRALADLPNTRNIELPRLGKEAVASIAAEMLHLFPAPRPLASFLARASEGNPFFVAEYLRTALSEGLLTRDTHGRWRLLDAQVTDEDLERRLPLPGSVRDLVMRRLNRLTPPARRLLDTAAVMGREMETDLVARAAAASGDERLSAIAELMERQVLEEPGPGRLRFLHDKIRETAYDGLLPLDRSARHRAAAQAIEDLLGQRPERLAELANHWDRAGEPARARPHYLGAARHLSESYALREAEAMYSAYLALADSPSSERVIARMEHARLVRERGRNDESLAELLSAHSEAVALGDAHGAAGCRHQIGVVKLRSGHADEARQIFAECIEIATGIGDGELERTALGSLANALIDLGRADEALSYLERVLEVSRRDGDEANLGRTHSNLSRLCHRRGDIQGARRHLEAALRIHERRGDRRMVGVTQGDLGLLEIAEWRLDNAERSLKEAIVIHRSAGNRRVEGIEMDNLGLVLRLKGRLAEAGAVLLQALAIHRELGNLRHEGYCLSKLSDVAMEEGQLGRARELAERALDNLAAIDDPLGQGVVLVDLAGIARIEGDLPRAEPLLDRAEKLLGRVGDPAEIARFNCARGLCALAAGRSAADLERQARRHASRVVGATHHLERDLAVLTRAQAAFEAGRPLTHGQLAEDLPAGLRPPQE